MSQNSSYLLQVLRQELNYIEQGTFDRERALLGTESPFSGTVACINHSDPLRPHTCSECLLHQFVPEGKQKEEVPCHHIPLSASGETVAELIAKSDQSRMATALVAWLRTTIAQLEATGGTQH